MATALTAWTKAATLLRDGGKNLIGQFFSPSNTTDKPTGSFEALTGHDGGLNVNLNQTDRLNTNVSYTTVPTGGILALPANAVRLGLSIQNTGSTLLEVYFAVDGSNLPTGNPVALIPPGSSPRDGYGGFFSHDRWAGVVAIKSQGDAAGGEFLPCDF